MNFEKYTSVCFIDKNEKVYGSGFFIDDNIIVTCSHIVKDLNKVKKEDELYRAKILSDNKSEIIMCNLVEKNEFEIQNIELDCSILQIDDQPNNVEIKPVEIQVKRLKDNENCNVLGFPDAVIGKGLISRLSYVGKLYDNTYQLNIRNTVDYSVVKGFSGAPVLNSKNLCVGMIIEYEKCEKKAAFMISITDIMKLAKNFLNKNIESKNIAENEYDFLHKSVVNKFLKTFIKERYESFFINDNYFNQYSLLFKEIITLKNQKTNEIRLLNEKDNVFEELLSLLITTNSKCPLKVSGIVGTGKSTFLSILYLYIYKKFQQGIINLYPFYIDLHRYLITNTKESQDVIYILDSIKKEIEAVDNLLSKKSKVSIIYIIDGTDEYIRSSFDLDDKIEELINKSSKSKKIIGTNKQFFENIDREKKDPSALLNSPSEYIIFFESISVIKAKRVEHFISIFINIYGKESILSINNILKLIKKYKIDEIDLNLLTMLIYTSKTNQDVIHYKSINELFYSYSVKYLKEYNSYCEGIMFETAKIAYQYINTKTIFNEDTILSGKWNLIHKHKSICNYLISYYIITILTDDLYSKEYLNNLHIFDTIYPKEVNRFMKEEIDKDKGTYHDKLFNTIKLIYTDSGITAKSHFCYLLGRIKDNRIRNEIKLYLNELAKSEYIILMDYIKTDIPELEPKDKNIGLVKISFPEDIENISERIRQQLILLRTISISLASLGDIEQANRYIDLLMRNKSLNSLNRGFHLEYYGDIRYSPINPLQHFDSVDYPFDNTYRILLRKINNYYNNIDNRIEEKDNIIGIEIFTLLSLAQERQNSGVLSSEIRSELLELCKKTHSYHLPISEPLHDYIYMMEINLSFRNYNIINLFLNLYKLKDNSRTGWRNASVLNPESITDHICGTLFIAMFFLPETKQDNENYSKNKILKLLLIHDIAESILGDIVEKDENEIKKENIIMKYLLMHQTYSCFSDLSEYYFLWKEWYENKSYNAKIANDIDKIEAILQYKIYLKQKRIKNEKSIDRWKTEERRTLYTDEGFRILKIINEKTEITDDLVINVEKFKSDLYI